ncbi:glycosyltransferase [Streptomyces sp. N2-109]|uniref:Glycosyltransferase n=1 Tax=Streptomyces gossypii TaxID=2883101 RepID=A0ABT2JU49_9ACTN|nr:glycosyltransferase [Streptomyces gossypii]MCT2591397.1 glycosyltransferase [Streptomyces gossypii]
MRVALMTAGSRGDVAPYTGLAHGLAQAGHEVTLVTHGCFAPLVASAGVAFHPLPIDPRAELASARGRAFHQSATGVGRLVRLAHMARTLIGEMADDLLRAARSSDVLLVSSSLGPLGHTLAEGLAMPSMGVYLQPMDPTGEFPPPVIGTRSLGRAGTRLAGHTLNVAVDGIYAETARELRTRLGLAPASSRAARRSRLRDWPVLHGFSPRVVPRPRDWRRGLSIAGYWWPHVPAETELSSALRDFLADGPPPVFVGLGSATVPDPDGLSRAVVRALRAAGLRGVIQRGWSGLHASAADMLTVDEVSHAAAFPHMAAVVHHAGAGTTAAGLRAGVPTVPVPVQFDAAFWSSRLVALGTSPVSVPLRRLTAPGLASALKRATTDPSYRQRARDLATRIREEDGVGPVLAAVDRLTGP